MSVDRIRGVIIAEPLFSTGSLSEYLGHRRRNMFEEIKHAEANDVLNVSEDDYTNYLVNRYSEDAPTLCLDSVYANAEEVEIDLSKYPNYRAYGSGRSVFKTGLAVTFHIPFEGQAKLFRLQASTFWNSTVQGVVTPEEVLLPYQHPESDTAWMKNEYERDQSFLLRMLEATTRDVARHNNDLKREAEGALQARKAKLLRDQDMIATLGVPVKRRDDVPSTYSVPDVRRKPSIVRPTVTSAPFKPEPTLAESEYDNILDIIWKMSMVLERSPRAFAHMDEEAVRDHFLVQLNGHYEGRATGETFNFEGKTDILIREDGRTIFIGECKFWKGAQKFTETIDQLLGYTSWRDTKTAILVFNRNKNLTAVLDQIPDIVASHPNHKRSLGPHGETGFRFRLSHRDDPNRELTLTVLVFDVPQPGA